MNLELEGKRALVTGGSRGIGKAVARVLAQEGADVALLARDASRLASCASELAAATGRRVIDVIADTTDDAQVRRRGRRVGHRFLCSPKSRAINGDAISIHY